MNLSVKSLNNQNLDTSSPGVDEWFDGDGLVEVGTEFQSWCCGEGGSTEEAGKCGKGGASEEVAALKALFQKFVHGVFYFIANNDTSALKRDRPFSSSLTSLPPR